MIDSIPKITAEEVKTSLANNEDIILLDVRTSGEYSRGKIEGSINLPVDNVANKISEIIPDKNKKIFVYCLSGSRSDAAVQTMIKLGYTNVFSMTSGLLAWRSKQYPLL